MSFPPQGMPDNQPAHLQRDAVANALFSVWKVAGIVEGRDVAESPWQPACSTWPRASDSSLLRGTSGAKLALHIMFFLLFSEPKGIIKETHFEDLCRKSRWPWRRDGKAPWRMISVVLDSRWIHFLSWNLSDTTCMSFIGICPEMCIIVFQC